MKRNSLATVIVVFSLLIGLSTATAAQTDRLITQDEAARHGLKRAWFTRVRLDSGQSRVNYLRLFERTGLMPDTLFVQTDQTVVHAINAETGQTLWSRAVGNRAHPTMPIGANAEVVGVLNGTHLYLLDRFNGRVLWHRRVVGVPADGPVLTDKYVFVPMVSGLILAYPIEKKQFEEDENPLPTKAKAPAEKESDAVGSATAEATPAAPKKTEETYKPFALKQESFDPLSCVSFGRITSQPIFTLEDQKNQYLAWSTTKGLFVGYVDLQKRSEFAVQYQLRSRFEIVTQPTYLPPTIGEGNQEGLIFTVTKLGEIHAVSATRGSEIWRYAIGQPIVEPVIPIGDRVYATTELGDFYCIEAVTGKEYWSTGDVGQFIAVGPRTVYVADRAGQIRVLDAKFGARLDDFFAADQSIKFRNQWTDRIYLATPTGLIQCLRETAQTEPLRHRKIEALKIETPKVEAAAGEEFIPAEPAKAEKEPAAEPKHAPKPKHDPKSQPGGANPLNAPQPGGKTPFDRT